MPSTLVKFPRKRVQAFTWDLPIPSLTDRFGRMTSLALTMNISPI